MKGVGIRYDHIGVLAILTDGLSELEKTRSTKYHKHLI